ncbi:DUF202 domain-containing protein [uncultured Microbulbifer sp.]|uniref:YidH family protein n=1 Tax=uncultured Microbulbifer sp. TaxID=348147 RepID=UPI0025DCA7AF|nr:DUF202 domain-containing protein [uncultured Microbulbifer sp.]
MIRNFQEHAANERTFLAWIRTAIAVVGFGIAIGRLGSRIPSPWTEVALFVTGGVVVFLSYLRMRAKQKEIDTPGEFSAEERPFDLLLLALVCSMFALMAFFTLHLV